MWRKAWRSWWMTSSWMKTPQSINSGACSSPPLRDNHENRQPSALLESEAVRFLLGQPEVADGVATHVRSTRSGSVIEEASDRQDRGRAGHRQRRGNRLSAGDRTRRTDHCGRG